MASRIEKTKVFLLQKFDENPRYTEHKAEKDYRIEHTMRVANIGKQIAEAEDMDTEALVIACLLHDVSYCEEMKEKEDWLSHGRRAAAIARPFLESLQFEPEKVQEICFGIAIHVDDRADFDGRRTPLAVSVGDADNLDRFDAYRIYETLEWKGYSKIPFLEKKQLVADMLKDLDRLYGTALETAFATELWRERIDFYRAFYRKLADQLANSTFSAERD